MLLGITTGAFAQSGTFVSHEVFDFTLPKARRIESSFPTANKRSLPRSLPFRLYAASVITLTLLHPIQSIPVQSWTFEHESVIRIGRSTDNHVILYSAVVSRHHVELRKINRQWEIVNLGANGTYLDGKRVSQVLVEDGVIIRLARSGPNIQIHIGASAPDASHTMSGEKTVAQRIKSKTTDFPVSPARSESALPNGHAANPGFPVTIQPESDEEGEEPTADRMVQPALNPLPTAVDVAEGIGSESRSPENMVGLANAPDPVQNGGLFCERSGQPLRILQAIGAYKAVKVLQQDWLGVTQVVWRDGQSLLLRTLNATWSQRPEAIALFEQQAKMLLPLNHPSIPRFLDFFMAAGHPCLVFEWVHGQNLKQQISNQGPLSQPAAVSIILQICDVLDYLHRRDPPVVHQDLKPENVIQRLSAATPLTVTVVGFASLNILGTDPKAGRAGYLAPELQQGLADPTTDLFALGPLLIYLLTGKEPAAFYAQREQGYRLYPEYVPGLSPDMATIIRRLTNPHLEERYASVREVVAAFGQLV